MFAGERVIIAVIIEHDNTHNKNLISLFLSLHENMYLRIMLVVCGILDTQNPAGNCPTQLFIDFRGLAGIAYLTKLHIKDVPHKINDHNLVPNQEAGLGYIQQRKLQDLAW